MQNKLKRLREPSTWAGISALAMLLGVPLDAVQYAGTALDGIAAAAALAAIVMPEARTDG